MGTINETSPKLYRSGNNNYIKLFLSLVKIKQIGKAVAIKTNTLWVLQHILCFVNAFMKLILHLHLAMCSLINQRKQVHLSFFSCVSCQYLSCYYKTELLWHLNGDFLTITLGGRLPKT